MSDLVKIIIGLASVITAAILTHLFTLTRDKKNLIKEQKYKYFFPFKYQVQELLDRAIHIEKRLFENQPAMKARFRANFDNKKMDWFFKDWEDYDKMLTGGYFLVSTLYMNCLLYYRMKELQDNYPYIVVKLKKSLNEKLLKDKTSLRNKRYLDELKKENPLHAYKDYEKWLRFKGTLDLRKVVNAIRIATTMRKGDGIPFGLHFTFGDFMVKDGKIINHEDFCKMLMDKETRVRFWPLINFWNNLIDVHGNVDTDRLNKVRSLILALQLVDLIELD